MGVESEIREALTNLIFNAVDAMPEGGTLTLRTRAVHGCAAPTAPRATRCVEVTDTGVGMDEETRRRCLEPFFTTKGERGTGLGLAMVYGMVQRHSAEHRDRQRARAGHDGAPDLLRAERRVGRGRGSPPAHGRRAVAPAHPGRRRRSAAAQVAARHARDRWPRRSSPPAAAQAGIDAFAAAQRRGEPFDVVITDLGMPYVDGRKVAGAVKAASPATPVILLTGWGQRLVADGDVPPHVDRVLSKPPKLRELRAALAQLSPGRRSS